MGDHATPDPAGGADRGPRDGGCDCSRACADGGERVDGGQVESRDRLERRDLAKVLATIGGLTAVGSLAAPLAGLTQAFERGYEGPVYADGVALVDAEGERVGEEFLSFGEVATVFPETHPGIDVAPTLLVRFPEEEYGEGTELAFTVAGYAAYSKVCTHAGCMVSDVEDTTLVCPCHLGEFDPLRGATVVGGPPPRPLPQLPITLSAEGVLLATGDFDGAVGPQEG